MVRHVSVISGLELMRSPVLYKPQEDAGLDSGYALAYNFASPKVDTFFWIVDNWYQVPDVKRLWVPFTEPITYEEGLALYTLWVNETQKDNDQLIVLFADEGCIRGKHDEPWIGQVRLAGFRGESLDYIERNKDEDMDWLARTYRWIADPKTKVTDPPWPHEG